MFNIPSTKVSRKPIVNVNPGLRFEGSGLVALEAFQCV